MRQAGSGSEGIHGCSSKRFGEGGQLEGGGEGVGGRNGRNRERREGGW